MPENKLSDNIYGTSTLAPAAEAASGDFSISKKGTITVTLPAPDEENKKYIDAFLTRKCVECKAPVLEEILNGYRTVHSFCEDHLPFKPV